MITKDNFITAYFIDSERKNIEILLKDVDKVKSHIVEYDMKYPVCQELLKVCTLDQLHENTYNKKKGEKAEFEEMVMRIAKKNNMIVDDSKVNDNSFRNVVNALFKEDENPDHLFALKLALFEVEKIRNSKDDENKKKLRQSKTKIEALQVAFDLVK
jgi:hypothetical protein|tara:strand:+ start:12099 stop:12569 length:471 start_codon:yes stop_codon:yes gene_type:complete